MMMDIRFLIASIVLLVLAYSGAFAVDTQAGNASVKCRESEKLSLLSLKHGFVDRYGKLSSWGNATNQNECCNWEGVHCDDSTGHVDELYVGRMEGTIASSLAELHHLKRLVLAGNNFNLTQFPSFICSLKNLQYLDLSYMNLKGKIPHELGDLLSLQELYLLGNQFEGGIPPLGLCNLQELYLSDNSLSGQLDDFVASFSHCAQTSLSSLDLSRNRFVGPLPNVSQFSSLENLFLDYNELNGTLNDSIGQLSNLQVLNIAHNSLQDIISETHFSRLPQLRYLDMSYNDFIFNVSPHWIPPFQLGSIYLACCRLGPTFPKWLQTQKSCSELDISSSEISDTIPSWFWNSSFRYLNLSHNQIIGKIPNLPSGILNSVFDLSSNFFRGSLPSLPSPPSSFPYYVAELDVSNNRFTDANSLLCPSNATGVFILDLSNNQLFGVLPDCWAYFGSLIFLSVANNNLSGKIPTSIGSLIRIQALHLGNNRFIGEIPLALNKCTELRTFDIVQNNFSGLVPSWIGDGLKRLRILIMRSNMFFGSLPSNICHLSQVQILDLSTNNISGNLPKCLNHLSSLANKTNSDATITYHYDLFLGLNKERDRVSLVWKYRESHYQSTLGLLKIIDFSSNMLTGEIPNELMDLVGLVSLNISRNMLIGQIPATIGQLKSLDFLDLSRNHLSGNIPSELSQIDRLSVMDLSYNNLSGEIPHGTQLQSFDPSSYMGNAKLCGAPLLKCPSKPTDDENSDAEEEFFNQGFYISLSVGFNAGFWGVCSLLFFNKSWRYGSFKLMNDAYDKLYVFTVINMAKMRRRNRVPT